MDKPEYAPRLLSLCSGIGCIDLAAQIAGCEIAGQVEIDPFCCVVLAKHWPDVPRKNDLKEVKGNEFGAIDIVAGGIPCQPYSSAGKRRGVEDDRHLWPFAFAIIQEAQPAWVLIENVRNFIPMALDILLSDLASAGYEAGALVLPACAVGAPHIRERCFVLAHLSGDRGGSRRTKSAGLIGQSNTHRSGKILAYPGGNRCGQWSDQQERQPRSVGEADACNDGPQATLAHTNGAGRQEQYAPPLSGELGHVARRNLAPGNGMADTQHRERERWMCDTNQPGTTLCCGSASTGTEPQPRMGRDADGATGWLDGYIWPALPGQTQHKNEPPRTIQGRQPYRNQRLKALGNGVVWQQVYPIFEAIIQQYAAFDR